MPLTRLDPVAEAIAQGLHLSSPAAMAGILTRGVFERLPHVDLINANLVKMAKGEITRLAVAMSPNHGKSYLTTTWHPVWRLALDPSCEIGIASYNFETARDFSKDIRALVKAHLPDLGVEVLEDSKAAHHWRTSDGGRVMASGIDGSFTSKHFDLIIIDDPVKGPEQAESPTYKKLVWQWYTQTVLTRLKQQDRSGVVVVQTRWAIDDLMGRIIEAERGLETSENYTLISLPNPAEANDPLGREPGEPLWERMMTRKSLERARIFMGSYAFSALHGQRPTPAGGGLIKHSMFNYWIPAGLDENEKARMGLTPVTVDGKECRTIEAKCIGWDRDEQCVTYLPMPWFDHPGPVQSWDLNFWDEVRAIFKGDLPDPVAGHVWGRHGPDFLLLDRFHARVGINATIDAVREMTERNPLATIKIVEFTANGPSVIAKLMHEIGGFVPATPLGSKAARVHRMVESTSEHETEARALTMFAAIEGGNFFLPHPALYPWVREFRENLGLFPKGGKDDTDAASQAWFRLARGQWKDATRAHDEALKVKLEPKTTQEMLRAHLQKERDRVLADPRPEDKLWIYANPS